MYVEPDVGSSFRRGQGHGKSFYDAVIELKPNIILEFGSQLGYSTISMAQALKELGRGKIYTNDIWTKTNHHDMLLDGIKTYGVQDFVEVGNQDFYDWLRNPTEFDLLYVDVDNDGKTLQSLLQFKGKNVMFEGGIQARDTWPGKENNPPMVGAVPFEVVNPTFPGLSKMIWS